MSEDGDRHFIRQGQTSIDKHVQVSLFFLLLFFVFFVFCFLFFFSLFFSFFVVVLLLFIFLLYRSVPSDKFSKCSIPENQIQITVAK